MNHLIAARTDMDAARAYWTRGAGESDRAFKAARKHSRRVRVLRIAVPAGVLGTLAVVALVSWFAPNLLPQLPAVSGDLVVSGSKITMQQPRLSGFTRDSRAYELTATAAAQDLTRPDMVELSNIRAKIQMQDKNTMELSADTGLYDSKGEMLTLKQNVLISSPEYQGVLSEALVDIRKGTVVSEKPVTVTMLQGKLNANRLDVSDSGKVILFHGGINMVLKDLINPADGKAAAR